MMICRRCRSVNRSGCRTLPDHGAADTGPNAVATDDRRSAAQHGREFHEAIAKGSHNALLVTVNALIREASADYRRVVSSVTGWLERSVEQHARIRDAIRARDAERGAHEMVHHLR